MCVSPLRVTILYLTPCGYWRSSQTQERCWKPGICLSLQKSGCSWTMSLQTECREITIPNAPTKKIFLYAREMIKQEFFILRPGPRLLGFWGGTSSSFSLLLWHGKCNTFPQTLALALISFPASPTTVLGNGKSAPFPPHLSGAGNTGSTCYHALFFRLATLLLPCHSKLAAKKMKPGKRRQGEKQGWAQEPPQPVLSHYLIPCFGSAETCLWLRVNPRSAWSTSQTYLALV